MKNIYKNFLNELENKKAPSFDTIRTYTKDLSDLLDLRYYIVNVVETNDNKILAQYNHADKVIEYNINKINGYMMDPNRNINEQTKLFQAIIANLNAIRHEIRHAEQNKSFLEYEDDFLRIIYIDSMSNQTIYDQMYNQCPLEIDADVQAALESNNFFKVTNNVNGLIDKDLAKKYSLNYMTDLYYNEGELISPAYLYYLALGKEKRYLILKSLIKNNEQRLRYGIDINYKLINDLKKTDDIGAFVKRR